MNGMNGSVLLAVAVCCSCGSITNVDEYLLRVDTVGYVDKPTSEQDPKETVLRSIEVVARPQSSFHSKVNIGTETLVVDGKLRPADGGGFEVWIRYLYSNDTGVSVPTEGGGRKSLPDTSAIETQIAVAVGDSIDLGGGETTVSESGKPERRSKTRYILVLTKYTPTDE